ncbi:MAG: hypothetical protein AB1486_29385 [Planctomycetota bacterium]
MSRSHSSLGPQAIFTAAALLVLGPSELALAQFTRHRDSHGEGGRFTSTKNLIEEGSSFEVGLDGFSVSRQLYSAAHGGTLSGESLAPEFVSEAAPHGSRVLKLRIEKGDQVSLLWHWVTVTGDPFSHRYIFSAYLRTDSGTLPFQLKVRARRETSPGQYAYTWQDQLTFNATPDWQRYSIIVQPKGEDPFDRDGEDPEPYPVTGGAVFEALIWYGRWIYRDWNNYRNPPLPESNGTLYVDAVQFEEAPLSETAPTDYEYPTSRQEMGVVLEDSQGPAVFSLFGVESEDLNARVTIFEEQPIAGSLDLNWTLEDSYGSLAASGTVPVLPDPARHPEVVLDLGSKVPHERGLYRLALELADPLSGEGVDRQEALLARIEPRAATAIDESSPFGIHLGLTGARATHGVHLVNGIQLEDVYDLAQQIGVRHIRSGDLVQWARVEWFDDDEQPFDFWDEPVLLAAERGMTVMPILGDYLGPYYRPAWVTGPPTNPYLAGVSSDAIYPDLDEWAEYAGAVGQHYGNLGRDLGEGHKISHYEIYNEPVASLSVTEYFGLLLKASTSLHAADPDALAVAPNPAFAEYLPVPGYHPYTWVEPAFTAEVLWYGFSYGYELTDVVSQHFYAGYPGSHFGPFEMGFGPGLNPDNVVERIELIREIMQAPGQPEKTLINSETGWSQPVGLHNVRYWRWGYTFLDDWSGKLDECRREAAFVVRSILQNLGEGVARYYQFILMHDSSINGGYGFGMTEFDGSPRVAITSFAFLTELLEGGQPFAALREQDLLTLENDGKTIGYIFDRPSSTPAAVLWNYDDPVFGAPADKKVHVTAGVQPGLADLFDMEGKRVAWNDRTVPAGQAHSALRLLTVDKHPLYIVARPGLGAAALLRLLKLR